MSRYPRTHARRRTFEALAWSALASLMVFAQPNAAAAVGFSLSAIGGSANGATGQVGDTLIVGIDLLLSEGDYVTIADPVLQWDLEGGNILDAQSAEQSGLTVNSFQLNPLAADIWRIGDPSNRHTSALHPKGDVGVLITGSSLGDSRTGPTFLWGFEQVSTVLNDDGMLLDILANGVSGAGIFRVGTVEFVLREPGTTTLSYLLDDIFPFRTLIFGSQAKLTPDSEISLESLSITSSAYAALTITVVPEPTTALLMALGLAGLSLLRRDT